MRKEVKKGDILKRPEYPGGQKAMREFIGARLQYPPAALKAGLEGTVHLRYAIDHKGCVKDVKVIRGLGHGCDEEAIRLVSLLRFNVEKTRGVKVLYHKTLQIHFHLPQAETPPPSTGLEVHYHILPAKAASPLTKTPPKGPPPITVTYTYEG
jgi:TonB family protein